MCPLVETALVADDLTGVERRSPPTRRFCRVAIETSPPEVLRLLRRGVVCMLDKEAVVRREAG